MIELGFWGVLVICALVGVVLGGLVPRLTVLIREHIPYGGCVLDVCRYPFDLYTHYARYLIPDSVYQLWYQVDMLDAETYRRYQDCGYIRSELDPQYIQRIESND